MKAWLSALAILLYTDNGAVCPHGIPQMLRDPRWSELCFSTTVNPCGHLGYPEGPQGKAYHWEAAVQDEGKTRWETKSNGGYGRKKMKKQF